MMISSGPLQAASYRGKHGSVDCVWFRLFGWGLHFASDNVPMLFSERNGKRKVIRLLDWRIKALRRGK